MKGNRQENVDMLNETIRGVLDEIKDFIEKGECLTRHTQDRLRNTLTIAAYLQSLTIQYHRQVNNVNRQRISLANMAPLMQDAVASSVHGYLPALIPPTILSKTLDTFEFYGLSEAIPRKLTAAYFTFEVVRDAYISDEVLLLLIEISLNTGHRATPIPQPIPQTERATQYHLLTKYHHLKKVQSISSNCCPCPYGRLTLFFIFFIEFTNSRLEKLFQLGLCFNVTLPRFICQTKLARLLEVSSMILQDNSLFLRKIARILPKVQEVHNLGRFLQEIFDSFVFLARNVC